jgi:membrane protein implicated in regulation of membrane protease activity
MSKKKGLIVAALLLAALSAVIFWRYHARLEHEQQQRVQLLRETLAKVSREIRTGSIEIRLRLLSKPMGSLTT